MVTGLSIILTNLFSQEVQNFAKAEFEYYLNKADLSEELSLVVLIKQALVPITILLISGALVLYNKDSWRNE